MLTYTSGRDMSVCEIASAREGVKSQNVRIFDLDIVTVGLRYLYLISSSVFINSSNVGVCLFGVVMNNDLGLVSIGDPCFIPDLKT